MKRYLFCGLAGLALVLLVPAAPAAAHPLGRFSVNQLQSLTLHPDRIDLRATVDLAELPTVQDKSTVDTSGDGTADAAELAAHAERACEDLAGKLDVAVDGDRMRWSLTRPTFIYQAGAAGLPTSRLDCELTAAADLGRPREIRLDNHYLVDRVGWREIIANGDGVRLIDPPVPAVSRSGSDLRTYPEELLASPPDVRSVVLRVEPGVGGVAAGASTASTVDAAPSWVTRGEERLNALVGDRGQGPWVGLLAVLLALTLGAAHAALPGHGKTVMAAYLAGKRGRARDAVAVGGVVTVTHTGGVLVVGLLLTTFAGLVGEAVLGWLGVVSGVLVVGVGVAMLVGLRRGSGASHSHGLFGHAHAVDGRARHGSTHDNLIDSEVSDGEERVLAGVSSAGRSEIARAGAGNPGDGHGHGRSHADDPGKGHADGLGSGDGHFPGDGQDDGDGDGHGRFPGDSHGHGDGHIGHGDGHRYAHGDGLRHGHGDGLRHSDGHGDGDGLRHGHGDGLRHGDGHGHGDGDGLRHGHGHGDGHGHGHRHGHGDRRPSRLGIAGIGIAGGLVPSPSALVVLLGAIALGRTWFGVLLVLAYGLGMAATLTAAGLALVGLQRRWAARTRRRGDDRWKALSARLSRVMPSATGSLVLIVGLGLVGRAAATLI